MSKYYSTPGLGVLGLLLRRAVERNYNRVVTLVRLQGNLFLRLEVFRLELRHLLMAKKKYVRGNYSENVGHQSECYSQGDAAHVPVRTVATASVSVYATRQQCDTIGFTAARDALVPRH